MRALLFTLAVFSIFAISSPVRAQDSIWEEMATNFKVTVKARDAKFIGTSMGGVHISIKNKLTGDIIADGNIMGGTGPTDKIMQAPMPRDAVIVDDTTASLQFSLALMEPTLVTITATGPLGQPQNMVSVSEDRVLIPGKDYTAGNGLMLEMPGMVVDVLTPVAGNNIPLNADEPLTILANVRKLCGCEITENGMWPASRYQVEVFIYKDAAFISSVPMALVDKSQYATKLKMPQAGTFRIVVTAFDPQTKDSGMDVTTVTLSAPKAE